MASQVTNHKCPACTGPLRFDGVSGKLVCDYCDSTYSISEIEAMYADEEAEARKAHAEAQDSNEKWNTDGFENWGVKDGMKAYSCPSCGAELICDDTTIATSCPYCGNPTVIPAEFSGGLKPNYILPFKFDEKSAKEALKNYYKGKKFLPDGFSSDNRIKELKGVYVPFWLFDGNANADAVFNAENIRKYRRGDYEITEVDHYYVHRAGIVPFEKIPVDASRKMPDEHMDAIEPFDYSELKEFSSAYLPGFLADKYDVSAEESSSRADERASNTAVAAMRADVRGYQICNMRSHDVILHRGKVHYCLLPVYMLCTKWKEQDYLFTMNGQTGKFVGNLPIDRRKYWTWFSGITAGVTAVLGTLLFFLL